MIEIGIDATILPDILDGRKTVEGRLDKGKFSGLLPGDIVSIRKDFYHDGVIVNASNNAARIRIESVKKYPTFRALLLNVGFENVIPAASNIDEATDAYRQYYSQHDEQENGVVAISFSVIE